MHTKYTFSLKDKSETEKKREVLNYFLSRQKAKLRFQEERNNSDSSFVPASDDAPVKSNEYCRSYQILRINEIKKSSDTPLKKISELVEVTASNHMDYYANWPLYSSKLRNIFHFEDDTYSAIVDSILILAEKEVDNGIERTVKEWYDLIDFILKVDTEKRAQKEVKVNYEEALANAEAQCKKYEKLAEEATNKQKELEKEISQLRSQLEANIIFMNDAGKIKPTNRLAITFETAIESYKTKVKTLEKKNKELQEKLDNAGEPLTVLADGVKEYVDEVGVDKAYDLFNRLNTILIDVPAWTKHASALKVVFKKARREMQNRSMVQGDLVVNKHVDKEVNGVSAGATGILISKDED